MTARLHKATTAVQLTGPCVVQPDSAVDVPDGVLRQERYCLSASCAARSGCQDVVQTDSAVGSKAWARARLTAEKLGRLLLLIRGVVQLG
jgi:hypothetical protein